MQLMFSFVFLLFPHTLTYDSSYNLPSIALKLVQLFSHICRNYYNCISSKILKVQFLRLW